MAELKPCPFCGGEAAFFGTTCTIKCKQCGGAFIATNPVVTRMEIAATENGGKEVTTMFQIELLSGGVFWVYAVDTAEDMFLIYRDSKWNWIGMEKCKPYYLKVSEWANKKFVSTFCSCGERKE